MEHILIQGKLKPFEGPKQGDEGKNVKFPGKLRSPFDDGGDEKNDGVNSKVPGITKIISI